MENLKNTKPRRIRVVWVTADSFIDVDVPVLSEFSDKFEIDWVIVISKSLIVNYYDFIESKIKKIKPNYYQLNYRSRDLRLVFQYFKLIQRIKKSKPDLIYVDCPGIPYFLPLLRLFLNSSKVIIAVHNVKTPKGAKNGWLAKFYVFFTMFFFKNIHVFSKSQHDYLKNRWQGKLVLETPLAIKDFGEPTSFVKNDLITFLNFGIIRDYKRIDILIKATELVYKRTSIPFQVNIAGACSNWEKYNKLINFPFLFNLDIRPILNDEIPDLFAKSHYFVLPYQDIAQSGALSVAFNYNLPILATKLPAFIDSIIDGENGYLFDVGSEIALANLMEKVILSHPLNYEHLQLRQREFIQMNLSTSNIVKKYTQYFQLIANK